MSDGSFLLCISGQIEWIDILAPAGSSWYCKYELSFGPDWKIVGGLEAGMSQIANVVTNGDKVVFNLPLEIQFKSTNPYGWPQIILSVYKNMQLSGYGRCYLPLKPGAAKLHVHLAKPQASSMLGYFWHLFSDISRSCCNQRCWQRQQETIIFMKIAQYAQLLASIVENASTISTS